jgi:hypothetical protein
MKSNLRSAPTAFLLALSFAFAGGENPEEPKTEASKQEPSAEPDLISADELWLHPAKYLGQTVRIEIQSHSEWDSWNPMLTRFGPTQFRAFRAWSDEQFPWVEQDYRKPLVRVFARHGSAAEWALDGAAVYSRFELTCLVSSNFGGAPWVEVLAVKPRPRRLTEGSVIHGSRGVEYMTKSGWKAAIAEFERASSNGIPEKAREELGRLIEICQERLPFVPPGKKIQ